VLTGRSERIAGSAKPSKLVCNLPQPKQWAFHRRKNTGTEKTEEVLIYNLQSKQMWSNK
jgi:hypothetical protein